MEKKERKQRQPKISLSQTVLDRLQSVNQTLKNRGASKVDMGEIIERLFLLDDADSIIDDFVSEKTPTEHKLMALMSDPEAKKQILSVIGDRKFGINSSNAQP